MCKRELIREGHWSICYRIDNEFYKVYRYPNESAIIRESEASCAAKDVGLRTPTFLRCEKFGDTFANVYEYLEMEPMCCQDIITSPAIKRNILNILTILRQIRWKLDDIYWYDNILEFRNALEYAEIYDIKHIEYLRNLPLTTFVHGDFTADNIGKCGNAIVIYDFQHGSLGPKGWDKSYFAATLTPSDATFLNLSQEEINMTKLIAGIRLGRAIRKNALDLSNRRFLYEQWTQFQL